MWRALVVIRPPIFDDKLRVGQRSKVVLIEAFVSEAAVERFNVSILGRLSWIDEVQTYSPIASPARYCNAGQLRAVVHHQGLRIATDRSDRVENARHANT